MLAVLDLIGIFVFALSGASLAIRKQLDIVGAVSLALATGLAGGVLRDLIIGAVPPAAFENQRYLGTAFLAALMAIVLSRFLAFVRRPVLVFDAAGLGLFTVVGTDKALSAGLGLGAAALLGVLSAVGGGIVRDVLVKEVPQIFTPTIGLYVIPASGGAATVAAASHYGWPSGPVAIVAAAAVFCVRLVSLHFGWSTPTLGEARSDTRRISR